MSYLTRHPRGRLSAALCLVLLILLPESARAATLAVTTTADHDDGICGSDCTLREAINAANNAAGNDTISFAAGVTGAIVITSGLPDLQTNINLQGPGANVLAVSAGGTTAFRIFTITGLTGPDPTVSISGLTISHGIDAQNGGGGIYNDGGRLTLTSCILTDNKEFSGFGGGGIHSQFGLLTLINCNLSGNTTSGDGGGIFMTDSNSAPGTLTLTNCTLSGNTAHFNGGGIYNAVTSGSGTATLTNCTLSGNTATGNGGGISNGPGTLTVNRCTLSGNSASDLVARGGAIANGGQLTLQTSTLSGNTATTSGASINNVAGATANVSNCTLLGDIDNSGTLTLVSTILKSAVTIANHSGTVISSGWNLSSDNGGGFLTGTDDQINTDPLLDPAGLQDNGGPTQTIALIAGSPALDKARHFFANETDQRGLPRTFDNPSIPNAPSGDGTDVGAYEADADPIQGALIVNTLADHNDGVCGPTDCTLREAIQRANAQSGANTITFVGTLHGTVTLQAALGTLNVTGSTTIIGNGAFQQAVDGNTLSRVFSFSPGTTSTVSGFTIRKGWVTGGSGSGASVQGGAIFNQATLTLKDCALTDNRVVGGSGILGGAGGQGGNGGAGQGGAIFNDGALTLNRCTFTIDLATGGKGGDDLAGGSVIGGNGGVGQGGAIFNNTGRTLTINNCTFNANNVGGGAGGNARVNGGGVGNIGGDGGAGSGTVFNLGAMTVTASTFKGNTGTGGAPGTSDFSGAPGTGSGGLVAGSGGASTLRNTISAGNTGSNGGAADVDGTFASEGYNLVGIGNGSSGFTGTGDQVGTTGSPIDPKLGSLQNNGGPTDTMALLANSPARDQGKSFGLTTDQRGGTRPLDDSSIANASGGDGSDIGAFEGGGTFMPASAVSRKVHGTGGPTFDIGLPLGGAPVGVECRSGGATGDHQLILTFANPVTVNGTPQAEVTSGIGAVGTGGTSNGGVVSVNGMIVTVPLTNVANAQTITIRLNSVSDGINTNNAGISMGVLLGDTSGNGSVNASDVSLTKSKSGQLIDASNFRTDVTVNGSINASDVSLVKSKSGTALP